MSSRLGLVYGHLTDWDVRPFSQSAVTLAETTI